MASFSICLQLLYINNTSMPSLLNFSSPFNPLSPKPLFLCPKQYFPFLQTPNSTLSDLFSCDQLKALRERERKKRMSCNGCRVLRKGCSETCILRPCLQWIESPEAQGHATVFVAKFFGRAGLMSFISAVPESQRPALFQSLLFEACGRTVNPVNGAVGLLWTGNWHVCQAAVETVLRGGMLRPMPELSGGISPTEDASDGEVTCTDMWSLKDPSSTRHHSRFSNSRSGVSPKRKRFDDPAMSVKLLQPNDLDLRLTPSFSPKLQSEVRRPGTPSMTSEESVTTATTYFESGGNGGERKVLNLFL